MSELIAGGRKHPDTSKKTRRANFRDARIKMARTDAEERTAAYQALSVMDRIAGLDRRLGANVGAVKERARLKSLLEKQAEVEEMAAKKPEPQPVDTAGKRTPKKRKN